MNSKMRIKTGSRDLIYFSRYFFKDSSDTKHILPIFPKVKLRKLPMVLLFLNSASGDEFEMRVKNVLAITNQTKIKKKKKNNKKTLKPK